MPSKPRRRSRRPHEIYEEQRAGFRELGLAESKLAVLLPERNAVVARDHTVCALKAHLADLLNFCNWVKDTRVACRAITERGAMLAQSPVRPREPITAWRPVEVWAPLDHLVEAARSTERLLAPFGGRKAEELLVERYRELDDTTLAAACNVDPRQVLRWRKAIARRT